MKTEWFSRPGTFFVLVGVGILVAAAIKLARPTMEHQDLAPEGTPAGYIELQEHTVRPQVTGYGSIKPELTLATRSEVSGRIAYLNPDLKEGEILPAGTHVLTIDDKDYRLALAKAEATLAQSKINLSDKQLQNINIESDLRLAKEKLALSHKNLERSESLFKRGSLSESAYERSRTSLLQLQQEVQKMTTQRDSLPYLVELQRSQIDIAQADVEARKRDLERTRLTIPVNYAARIIKVNVEEDEFVPSGTVLFTLQGLERVKINTQLTVEAFSKLLASNRNRQFSLEDVLQSKGNISHQQSEIMGLSATARMAGTESPVWPAKVARIDSNLDPATRTVGVIVTVDNPYQDIQPGVKPPLMDGLYMEVTLQGAAGQYLVIPRVTIHKNQIYQLDDNSDLKRIQVKGFTQGDMLLALPEQVPAGRIISSDLFPAVSGMKINPYHDQQTEQAVAHWLEGR